MLIRVTYNDRGFALAAELNETSGAGPLMINIYNLAEPARSRLAQNPMLAAVHTTKVSGFLRSRIKVGFNGLPSRVKVTRLVEVTLLVQTGARPLAEELFNWKGYTPRHGSQRQGLCAGRLV